MKLGFIGTGNMASAMKVCWIRRMPVRERFQCVLTFY